MRGANFDNHYGLGRRGAINLLFLLTAVWLELGSCISLPHHHSHSHRAPRESGTDPDTALTLQFVLLTNTTAECVDSLVSVELYLSYRTLGGDWETLRSLTRIPGDCDASRVETVPLPQDSVTQGAVQFRWRQQEQAWGSCNCWQIDDVRIGKSSWPEQLMNFTVFGNSGVLNDNFVCTHYGATAGHLSCLDNDNDGLVFCGGSASIPRGVVTPMYNLTTGQPIISDTDCNLFEPIDNVQLSDGSQEPFIKVSFQLAFNGNAPSEDSNARDNSCDVLDAFDEGVELSLRTLENEDGPWVPLKFYTLSSVALKRVPLIDLGSYDNISSILSLRGYSVSVVAGNTSVMNVTEYICDKRFFQEEVQFRWLQTAKRFGDERPRDTWFIDKVEIAVHESQNSSRIELSDEFRIGTSINNTLWPQIRGGLLGGSATGSDIGRHCVPSGDVVLFFGADDGIVGTTSTNVFARMAVTKSLDLQVPDINECAEDLRNCDMNANCTNIHCGFICTCREGYTGNGTICINIDECVTLTLDADCDMNADCADTDGSFNCTCREGYTGNGFFCTNINECVTLDADCDTNAECADTDGSFDCTCRVGYTGNGMFCTNIDECVTLADCDVNANCTDTDGSFNCTCREGYTGNGTFCSAVTLDIGHVPTSASEASSAIITRATISRSSAAAVNVSTAAVPSPPTAPVSTATMPSPPVSTATMPSPPVSTAAMPSPPVSTAAMPSPSTPPVSTAAMLSPPTVPVSTADMPSPSIAPVTTLAIPSPPTATVISASMPRPSTPTVISAAMTSSSAAPVNMAAISSLLIGSGAMPSPITSPVSTCQEGYTGNESLCISTGQCPTEHEVPLFPGSEITYNWTAVEIGGVRRHACPEACQGLIEYPVGATVRRNCTEAAEGDTGEWLTVIFTECVADITTLKLCEGNQLGSMLGVATATVNFTASAAQLQATAIEVISNIIQNLTMAAARNELVRERYLEIIDNVVEKATPEAIQQSQMEFLRIIESLEILADFVIIPENATNRTLILIRDTFAILVQDIDPERLSSIAFSADLDNAEVNDESVGRTRELMPDATASAELLDPLLDSLQESNRDFERLSYTIFFSDTLFQTPETACTDIAIGSFIQSIRVNGSTVVNKTETVILLSFQRLNEICNGTQMSVPTDLPVVCATFRGAGRWTTDSCRVVSDGRTNTRCECSQLGHFGLLFDLNPGEPFAPLALAIISYVGAGISIISLIIIVGTYCASKKLRSSEHGQLLVNLSVALIGLYITFLLGGHVTTIPGLCTLVSALLHYFILAFFGWTLAQAINLYHKLVIVVESPVHHFVLKAALVVWLTPLLIVGISLGPGHTYYANPYYCRPTAYPFWFGLVFPFLLIYLLNWIIFVLIMVSLIKKRSTEQEHKKLAVIAIGLSIVFGLGWGLGLAATSSDVEEVTFTFQVIFSIFVGSQGLLIFIFHGIRSEIVRKEWAHQWKKLPCVKRMRSRRYPVSTSNQAPGYKVFNQTNSDLIMNGSLDKNITNNKNVEMIKNEHAA